MAAMIDSNKQELNSFQIVHTAIEDAGDTTTPLAAQLAGIMAELSQPNSKVIQFGNTLFVAHIASGNKALVRAFNADIAANFVSNMQSFGTYAYDELNVDVIVIPGVADPALIRLLQAAFAKPARPNMGYEILPSANGRAVAVARLGPSRS